MNFPDEVFRSYIQEEYGDTITTSTIAEIKHIYVPFLDIYDLTGIEHFTALEKLDCFFNNLTTLDVSKNTGLTELHCDNNQLTTLDVSKNTALEVLSCSYNQLTTLDLSNNTKLYSLYCDNNQIQPFSLSRLTNIAALGCDFTITRSNGMYYLNLTALKNAWGVKFEPADSDDVYVVHTGNVRGPSGYKLSELKDTSSGEYVVCFSTQSKILKYVTFSFNDRSFDLVVYPASGSSSEPSSPTDSSTAPSITTTELDPATVGTAYSFQMSASAAATWSVKGKLPDGLSMSSTGLITGTPTKDGKKKITFTAENTAGNDKKKLTLTVYALPVITTESLKPATVGKKYSETIKGAGTTPLTWAFESTLPDGLTLDTNKHKISGKPTINTPGRVTVTLANPVGSVTKTFTFSADAILPEIKTKSLKAGTWNKAYKAVIKTKGTEPITLTLSGDLPEGLTFDASTGNFSGTPTKACYDRPIIITASNMGGSEDKTYSLTIKAVPPKLTTKKLPDAVKGKPYSTSVEATGTPVITWAATGLPAGLSMNTSGEISGTPTEFGKFKAAVTATNLAKTAKKKLKLNVLAAPEISGSGALASGTEGKSYKHTFTAAGSKTITFSIAKGSLPSGVTLSAKGKLSGKPTAAGTFEFTVKAANSAGEDSKDFTVTIAAKPASNKSAYTYADTVTDFDAESYPDEKGYTSDEYVVVAELPEVSVDVSGMYDFSAELDENTDTGAVLVWLANSGEPSDDDEIAEFSDEDGHEIDSVPENRKVNVSAWLNAGKVYKPAVAVKR